MNCCVLGGVVDRDRTISSNKLKQQLRPVGSGKQLIFCVVRATMTIACMRALIIAMMHDTVGHNSKRRKEKRSSCGGKNSMPVFIRAKCKKPFTGPRMHS